jgi:hypothetical protein
MRSSGTMGQSASMRRVLDLESSPFENRSQRKPSFHPTRLIRAPRLSASQSGGLVFSSEQRSHAEEGFRRQNSL